ncbi:MAG: hypothetical protein IKU13_05030 [Clostridia bacterium]|nr:hypothetical protein [Clostridia bacterium]
MKKIFILVLCLALLAGCTVQTDEGTKPNIIVGIVFMLAGAGGIALSLYLRTLDKDKEGTGWYNVQKYHDIKLMIGAAILLLVGLTITKNWIEWFFAR